MKNRTKLLIAAVLGIGSIALAQTFTSNTVKFGNQTTSGDKRIIFNRGSANPILRWSESNGALQFSNDGVNFSDLGSGSGSGSGLNLITKNPDFEQSITTGWTNSGATYAAATSGSNLLFGKQSATWTPSAGSQTLTSDAYTVPNGLTSGNCAVGMWYKGGSSSIKLQALDGSNNVLVERVLSATTVATPFYATFVCPSSGTVKLRVASTASSAIVALDRMFLGENSLAAIGQASLWGSEKWIPTTNCGWSNSSASWASYAADTDCTNPSGSNLQANASAPSTKIPAIKFASLPPGRYMFVASGFFYKASTASANCEWRVHDGTNAWRGEAVSSSTTARTSVSSLVAEYEYTTAQSNITLEIQEQSLASDTCQILADDSLTSSGLTIQVYRFPSVQEQAYKPDAVANSWSGYHSSDCVWTVTQTTYAADFAMDASCTFTERSNVNFGTVTSANDGTPGNNLPGIVFTPTRAGTYHVCAHMTGRADNAVDTAAYELFDGTTVVSDKPLGLSGATVRNTIDLCGNYKATSTASVTLKIRGKVSAGQIVIDDSTSGSNPIEWSIYQIDQALPAPLLVHGVVSPSSGVEQITRASFTNAGSCAIASQSGAWVSGVSDPGAGRCGLTIAAGTFSAVPTCTCTAIASSGSICHIESGATSTSLTTKIIDDTGAAVDQDFNILCMGPK